MGWEPSSTKRGWHYNNETRNLEAYNNGNEIFQYPFGQSYYVDSINGSATSTGLSWATAYNTISLAMTAAAALGASTVRRGGVSIFVAPGGYTEDVETPLNTVCPFGQLIAVSPGPDSFGAAWLQASTASAPALAIRARGWYVAGFEFDALTDSACVYFDGVTTNANASGTVIEDCLFVGQNQGLYGLQVTNTNTNAALCVIRNNRFYGFASGSTAGACMQCTDETSDAPGLWTVEDNWFADSDNLIKDMSFKMCTVRNNTFVAGGANQSPTQKLKNTNGSLTNFYGNSFGGTYTPAGGYAAGSGDDWAGNMAEDVAGEAANGWTYNVPSD
jgi:hypothetical protein